MSDNYIMLDGTKIEMSEETVDNMRGELLKDKKPECWHGGDIKLGLDESNSIFNVTIALGRYPGYDNNKVGGLSSGNRWTVVPVKNKEIVQMRDKLNELIDYLKIED